MPVTQVLSVVFPVFSVIGIGYLFARYKKISLEPVIEILLYLTIPALVISSLSRKKLVTEDLVTVSVAAVAVILGTGLVSYLYLGATKRRELKGFYLPTMFMNSGNMAFPLSLLAFGPDGLTIAILYYIAVSLMVYSLGIYIAKGKGGFAEIFKLPLIYAAGIGIGVNLAGLRIPAPALTAFDMLGAATIPIMQISLGYRLYSTSLKYPGLSIAGSVIRIGGGLAIAWVVVSLLGIDGLTRQVILLTSAMPSAVISFIVSHKYRLNSDLVASIIAASTLASIITVPLVLMLIS